MTIFLIFLRVLTPIYWFLMHFIDPGGIPDFTILYGKRKGQVGMSLYRLFHIPGERFL